MLDITTTELTNHTSAKIIVIGTGGAGGNAINNMIMEKLEGCEFAACNTDVQALSNSKAEKKFQIGKKITEGLGAGANPEIGRESAEENFEEIANYIDGANMVFISTGMGGGTGTGSAPVIARAAREKQILTVGVVTKPFEFEGVKRMRQATEGIEELKKYVDTLIVIPNEKLYIEVFDNEPISEAFKKVDRVLYLAVQGVTDLMVKPGLINLDFNDIKTVMQSKGKAMMGVGEASKTEMGIQAASIAAESAICNPLLEDDNMKGAKSAIINITSNDKISLNDVNVAVNRLREEIDHEANIIYGHTIDETIGDTIRVSIVATGIDTSDENIETPEQFDINKINPASSWIDNDTTETSDSFIMEKKSDDFKEQNNVPIQEPDFLYEQTEPKTNQDDDIGDMFKQTPPPIDPFMEADMANATRGGAKTNQQPEQQTYQPEEKINFLKKMFGDFGKNKSNIQDNVKTEPIVNEKLESENSAITSSDGSLALNQQPEQDKDIEIPSFLRKQMN